MQRLHRLLELNIVYKLLVKDISVNIAQRNLANVFKENYEVHDINIYYIMITFTKLLNAYTYIELLLIYYYSPVILIIVKVVKLKND